ncbi:MAG TPA: asparagine--tRNA ligase [Candidatus Aminicenantes bacterium]|nr:asparagine--tRNA ligase [Candidatus Aminicenantes bacterium]
MAWTTVKQIYSDYKPLLDSELEVRGWIRTQRESKNFAFIELNDGSCFKNLQIVYDAGLANFAEVGKFPLGTSLKATGRLVASPGAGQPFEMKAASIEAVGLSALDYPLQKKRHSFEFLRTIPHLRTRSNTFMAVFRVRSLLAYALHKFFHERGFVYVHTPIITGSDCEGAGQMFRVTTLDPLHPPVDAQGAVDFSQDFFGRETSLTVSGQLNVEGFCLAFGRVYTFSPTFRAENSNTQRHASEFWMIEPEIAFADLGDDMRLAEDMLKYVIRFVLEQAPQEMEFFNRFIDTGLLERLHLVAGAEFERITYTRAIEILRGSGQKFNFPPEWGKDIQTEHERYLTDQVFRKPVFVTDYPKEIKAFYMRLNDDGRTVAAMDLLVPEIGEIVGGSQREERHDVLQRRIAEMGLNEEDYRWYLDLRRFGGAPHAGFGLGLDRAVMYLTGMENIRDVIPYPRTPKSAEF